MAIHAVEAVKIQGERERNHAQIERQEQQKLLKRLPYRRQRPEIVEQEIAGFGRRAHQQQPRNDVGRQAFVLVYQVHGQAQQQQQPVLPEQVVALVLGQ